MAFPQSPLGAKVQLQISGVWTDATRYDSSTRVLQDAGITIGRGKSDVQDQTPASTCTWEWLDPNGVYSNENPRSPYFGILPRNTPVRVYVPRSTPALYIVDQNDGAGCRTADKAALDIVGDIDVRVDIEPTRFRRFGSNNSKSFFICGKYGIAGNREWHLRLNEAGILGLSWSENGTGAKFASATAPLPSTGRICVKVFLDVDNGAGGYSVTFSTSSTINGTYTTLGSVVTVTSGVSFIFNGTSPLEVGTIQNGAINGAFSPNVFNYLGRVYAMQVRNSAGTLVASPDFTSQAVGTTSFSDGLGNTWATSGVAEITNADYRFHGELSAPKQKPKVSRSGVGVDVRMQGEAGGIIRRLTANATPVKSPIYRNFNVFGANGWWTGEDDSGATLASSAVSGADPAPVTDITFSGFDATLAGSAGVMTLGGTGPLFIGNAKPVATTSETHFVGYFKFPTVPLSNQTLFTVYGNGTVRRWDFVVGATTYTLNGYDVSGTLIASKTTLFGTGGEPTNWIAYHLQLTNAAGTVTIKSEWYGLGNTSYFVAAAGTVSYAGDNGTFTQVVMQGITALSGAKIAHLVVSNLVGLVFLDNAFSIARYSIGYAGETADARFTRVCLEEGVRSVLVGLAGNSEAMGSQPIDEIMNILYECAAVDGGYLSESRDQLALEYRTRTSLLNQYPMTLSYTSKHLSSQLESTPDDANVTNDVAMSRVNGGTARAILTTGPMSILAPSAGGIGRVPSNPEINNYLDSRLPYLAQYALGFGTWPEARYPSVQISLHRSPFTTSNSLFLLAEMTNLGNPITITDLPSFMPASDIRLMVQGTTEEIRAFTWDITYNTSPYGPYIANETSTVTGEELRADATASVLTAAITSTATSFSVTTSSGPVPITTALAPAEFPADIIIGGERMTLTAVVGATSPQTFTVTRSVNGVVKAQVINAPVTVYQSFNAAL